jgi:tagatose 6-phosphate kinase
MIVIVCANPALDITYAVPSLRHGGSHRVRQVREQAGGKGINVARVLKQIGTDSVVVGFAGGPIGEAVHADLDTAKISHKLTPIKAHTRRSIAVVDADDATVFNEPGPVVTPSEWQSLTEQFAAHVAGASVVVLAGSLPRGVAEDAYAHLVHTAHDAGAPVIVDADGHALRHAIAAGPYLVKPNVAEAAELFDGALESTEDVLAAADALRARGASAVIISRGSRGLVAVTEDGSAFSAHSRQTVCGNPTGAGDALTAAIARGVAHSHDWTARLNEAIALAAACVAVDAAGHFDEATRDEIKQTVEIKVLR